MLLYTVMPLELVLAGEPSAAQQQVEEINGVLVLVETQIEAKRKIVRVLSIDPRDFLNPAYAPGTIVE